MEEIAERLGLSEGFLWNAYSLARSGRGYTIFKIPKRSGGTRKIHRPSDKLRYVQYLIKRHILDQAPQSTECVTAFRKGISIRDNASAHCNKAVLVKFDLKDFFPSVSLGKIVHVFKSLGFDDWDSQGLAYLTTIRVDSLVKPEKLSAADLCYIHSKRLKEVTDSYIGHLRSEAYDKRRAIEDGIDFGDLGWEADCLLSEARRLEQDWKILPKAKVVRGLPQGAPTSPQLANLAARRLDARIQGLANRLGFKYTRYADDLTFSSSDPRAKTNVLGRFLEQIIRDCGFEVNSSKTSFMRAPATRQTTGLIVNEEKPRVRRHLIRKVRAMIHHYCKGSLPDDQLLRLSGYLSFIRMINPEQSEKLEAGMPKV
ncbi:reverse transcriptase family protein [Akkermansiaceae bacterium]|nr:reverse transcriptase family protein [Akkermansiaceae bacterium]